MPKIDAASGSNPNGGRGDELVRFDLERGQCRFDHARLVGVRLECTGNGVQVRAESVGVGRYRVHDREEGFGVGAAMPWGAAVEKKETCAEKTVAGIKGFVWDGLIINGLVGTFEGLGTLIGYNPETRKLGSGETAAAAWSNLGVLGVGLLTTHAVPALSKKPGPIGNFYSRASDTLLNTGKGLIAYDTWGKNNAEAAGTAVFNVATFLIPVGGAAAGGAKVGERPRPQPSVRPRKSSTPPTPSPGSSPAEGPPCPPSEPSPTR